MTSDLEDKAGGKGFSPAPDPDRLACMSELAPVVRRLMERGMWVNAIVGAPAELSFHTGDRRRGH